jgi:hypothetical protein
MNRDLALADWLEELAVYGTPRRFPDAETAYHLSQLIRHRYIVTLALAHTQIGLRALGTPAPIPAYIQPELLESSDQWSPADPRPSKRGRRKLV